jgi:hypothetical protein
VLLYIAVRQKMGTWWQVQKDRKKWDFTHTAKKDHSNPQYKRGPKFDPPELTTLILYLFDIINIYLIDGGDGG